MSTQICCTADQIVIREGVISDAGEIARVDVETWRACYRGIITDKYLRSLSVPTQTDLCRKLFSIKNSGRFIFVAESERGEIVGYAAAGPERKRGARSKGELYAIYILPEFQRKGTGRLLVRSVMESFEAAGVRSLLVWVLAANPARNFYRELGGKSIRTRPIGIGGIYYSETCYEWTDFDTVLRAKGD
ncbi:MAG TPA: GNAT family N-acetyltransferase [Syntrophales bacterium]|nr:GNAT family N-acetyltransferase [Syntrophales bacterium]